VEVERVRTWEKEEKKKEEQLKIKPSEIKRIKRWSKNSN
jgi:hypothetical protein